MGLNDRLRRVGLRPLGECQDGADVITLIGPDEPHFWPIFRASPEYGDGAPNPLDRWSARVVSTIAAEHNGTAIFPFGGPPYAPFQNWALKSGRCWTSPIGFLVHEDAGLFVSFRGAIRQPGRAVIGTWPCPCDTCEDQPCKAACPVDAFADGYDVGRCKTYLRSPNGASCMKRGCAARRACPVGQANRLPDQAAFHMKAFL